MDLAKKYAKILLRFCPLKNDIVCVCSFSTLGDMSHNVKIRICQKVTILKKKCQNEMVSVSQ